MEAIEVTVRFDGEGKAYPQQFIWRGGVYAVTSTGRRWQEQEGEQSWLHVLVMTVEMKTYELVFHPQELRWYLEHRGANAKLALST